MTTSNQDNQFADAVAKSLIIIKKIFTDRQFSISLLDAHAQLSEDGKRFVMSDHLETCTSLPIFFDELQRISAIEVCEDLQIETAAYVGIMATGGVEWNTITILKVLESQGIVVSRIKPDVSTGDLNREALKNGLPVYCNYGCEAVSPLSLTKVFERISPSVLWICNWSVQDENESDSIYKLCDQIRLIDQRAYDTKEGWIETIDKKMAKSIDHFIATNGVIASEIQKRVGKKTSIDVTTIRPVLRSQPKFSSKPPSNTDIFQISRLSKQKRLDRGLNLYRSALAYGYNDSWNIVGDGPLRFSLELSCLKLPNVHFYGFKPTLDIINSAYGLVQSSDFEGLPMVVIEALAAGVPVFATETGDLPWLKSQISDFDCELLTLSTFDNEDTIKSNFLTWRRNLHNIWNASGRFAVSQKVINLFDPLYAANAYLRVFK